MNTMKKIILLFSLILGLGIMDATAQQEVRGIEIKVITYEGKSYSFRDSNGEYVKRTTWYGWELCNRNSISVSIDVEVWVEGNDGEFLYATESIVLDSGERYKLKAAPYKAQMYANYAGGVSYVRDIDDVNRFIKVKYKAYKLE